MTHRFFQGLAFLALVALQVLSQQQATPANLSSSAQTLQRVWERLNIAKRSSVVPAMRLQISEQPVVNAWADPKTGDITVTRMLVEIVGPNEGELAFVLAHEMGHVVGYWTGQSEKLRQEAITADQQNFLKGLGLLFSSDEYLRNRYLQVEEQLADAIGLYVIYGAGYNPFDAAGFLGRMQMYFGNPSPWQRIWNSYLTDHPFHADRIENLRLVLAHLPQRRFIAGPATAQSFLWLGHFAMSYIDVSGRRQSMEFVDLLGVYSEEDFRIARTLEVKAREQVIRAFIKARMSDQVRSVQQIRLLAVEKKSPP